MRWRTGPRRQGDDMRRSMRVLATLILLLAGATASLANMVTLNEPVDLRVKPGVKRPVAVTAPAGAQLVVLDDRRDWIVVSFEGKRFWAPVGRLVAATPTDQPSPDPTCDYGYPYSGSNYFFTHPLAQLRHSEPLGFLLGYHRFYPC